MRFVDNHATAEPGSPSIASGGGIRVSFQSLVSNPAKLFIGESEISQNSSPDAGGGLGVKTAALAGGAVPPQLSIYNSTFSTNEVVGTDPVFQTGYGGGIALEGPVWAILHQVTITKNVAYLGGGIWTSGAVNEIRVGIANSLIVDNYYVEVSNAKPSSIFGLYDTGYFRNNQIDFLSNDDRSPDPPLGVDEALRYTDLEEFYYGASPNAQLLGPLQFNGGPTRTHALLTGNPAIDGGDNDYAVIPFTNPPVPLTTDQRGPGFTRIFDVPGVGNALPADVVDIGAYEVGLPKVIDVRIFGEDWAAGAPRYSAVEQVPLGKQLAPIGTDGVDTIEIHFSEDVLNTSTALTLYGTTQNNGFLNYGPNSISHSNVAYDDVTHVATWTFSSLPLDKYRIELSTAVTDVAGNALDGEWMNLTNGTFDDFADDPTGRTFLSGNGAPGAPNNVFRFFFSLLPGDSNQDGVVTSADTAGTIADVNGDGVGDNVDIGLINNGGTDVYTVVNANGLLDTWLPLRIFEGDYVDDELVRNNSNTASDPLSASHDYDRWQLTVNTPILDADGNGDGSVDAADYVVYANNRYDYSGWYVETPPSSGSGSGSSISQVGVAPQVINVLISGSNSVHSAFSFAEVVGSGDQLGTVPVGGADTVEITFSEPVNVSPDMLRFQGLHFGERPALVDFTYDTSTQTAKWQFANITRGDHYLVALSDAITDIDGDQLDGEWVNPNSIFTTNTAVTVFPSGDGYAGGDFNFVVTILPGDANLDGQVNSSDTSIFLTSLWSYLTPAVFTDGDFDGSGSVTRDDLPLIVGNYGINLQTLGIRADLNGDLKVDDSDRDILYNNWSNGLQNPTHDDGDLDGDGDLDIDDFDLLFAQFGVELTAVS